MAPREPIEIRRAKPGDGDRVIEAFNQVFGLQRSSLYWLQKFSSTEGMLSFLATDRDGLVFAQFSGWPVLVRHERLLVPVLCAGDIFARRSAQAIRRRLFVRTQLAFHDHFRRDGRYAAIIGFPNEVSLKVSRHATPGVKTTMVDHYLVRPGASHRRWRGFRHRTVGLQLSTSDRITPAFRSAVETIWRRRNAERTPPETARTADWITWRFQTVGRHYGSYAFHVVSCSADCSGWFITRDEDGATYFIDWGAPSEELAAYRRLAQAFEMVLESRQGAIGRVFASLNARLPFANLVPAGDGHPAPIVFGSMEYKPLALPYHEMRLTFGDTDFR